MRTTLNIEETALAKIKKYADEWNVSLGQATSDLVHKGAEALPKFRKKNGWVVFDVPADAPPLTNERLDQWEADGYEEEYRLAVSPRR